VRIVIVVVVVGPTTITTLGMTMTTRPGTTAVGAEGSTSPDSVLRPVVVTTTKGEAGKPQSHPPPFDDADDDEAVHTQQLQSLADQVVQQYDEDHARIFYQFVMGGGGHDIHYGIFRRPTDGVYEASQATNERLLTMLDWSRPIEFDGSSSAALSSSTTHILDLGSGHGGLSHAIAQRYGCRVTGLNLCAAQNDMNIAEAKLLNIDHLVDATLGNFNDGLPNDWAGRYTHVVCCEVLCHAADKEKLFRDVYRVLQPGGAFVFTDIMGADAISDTSATLLKDFTDRNATTQMARPSEYRTLLNGCGFEQASYVDFSHHLLPYFSNMVDQIIKHRDDMLLQGVPATYLDRWMESLTSRVRIQESHQVFAWGIFTGRKPGPVY
jgi:sarcosine/dimethylglycine N-methyltransferase